MSQVLGRPRSPTAAASIIRARGRSTKGFVRACKPVSLLRQLFCYHRSFGRPVRRARASGGGGDAPMGEPYNTNLAAEFHVLSLLHRLGADAALSLGNKKAVDITVVRAEGEAVTIDVKGVAGPHDWPADNVRVPDHDRHFLALVSFEGRIGDPVLVPSVWVVPARELRELLRTYRTRVVVSRAAVRAASERYRHAWHLVTGQGLPARSRRAGIHGPS